jgi:ferritin-like metal-binding protein YciE
MAEMLDQMEAAELLDETLEEERAADENLTDIAEAIMSGEEAADEEEEAEAEGELDSD